MSTTLMILLGIPGILAAAYFLAQITRANDDAARQRTAPHHPYPPNTVLYQPQPQVMERPSSGISLWPVLTLILIGAIFYIGYQDTTADRSGPVARGEASPPPSASENGAFEYDFQEPEHYYDHGEQEMGYIASPSTPRTWESGRQEKESQRYIYRQGYGVQLFAAETGWWEEAHLRLIQRAYPNQVLLISPGYTSEGEKVMRFMLGSFENRTEAMLFARSIQETFPDAFPVKLSELEAVKWRSSIPKA